MQNRRPIAYDIFGFGQLLDEGRVVAEAKWLALEPRLVVVPVGSGMPHRGVWHGN